jgi:toxin HigB-1
VPIVHLGDTSPRDPAGLLFRLPIDKCHVTVYIANMIRTFADKHTQELYATGRSKRLPPDITRRATRKLEYLDLASGTDDLKVPSGNRLHELGRDRKGQYSISVNDQWRICFRFVDGDAYDVEITDYH